MASIHKVPIYHDDRDDCGDRPWTPGRMLFAAIEQRNDRSAAQPQECGKETMNGLRGCAESAPALCKIAGKLAWRRSFASMLESGGAPCLADQSIVMSATIANTTIAHRRPHRYTPRQPERHAFFLDQRFTARVIGVFGIDRYPGFKRLGNAVMKDQVQMDANERKDDRGNEKDVEREKAAERCATESFSCEDEIRDRLSRSPACARIAPPRPPLTHTAFWSQRRKLTGESHGPMVRISSTAPVSQLNPRSGYLLSIPSGRPGLACGCPPAAPSPRRSK